VVDKHIRVCFDIVFSFTCVGLSQDSLYLSLYGVLGLSNYKQLGEASWRKFGQVILVEMYHLPIARLAEETPTDHECFTLMLIMALVSIHVLHIRHT
jgi:hypothetical protein